MLNFPALPKTPVAKKTRSHCKVKTPVVTVTPPAKKTKKVSEVVKAQSIGISHKEKATVEG